MVRFTLVDDPRAAVRAGRDLALAQGSQVLCSARYDRSARSIWGLLGNLVFVGYGIEDLPRLE